jgi:hypothetical protein
VNKTAQLSPSDYVLKLRGFVVPGYDGYPGGVVAISRYLSGNEMFGGNSSTGALNSALQKITAAKNESALLQRPGMSRLFGGQASLDNMIAVMEFIVRNKADFAKVDALKPFFKETDYLQAMCDNKCFGLDCIGFMGTYMVEAGLVASYPELKPIDYTSHFKPVQALKDVTPYSAVMLTNGLHIQIIESILAKGNGYIDVRLCQSSAGKDEDNQGPQTNENVRIFSGGGDYLPVDKFRAELNDAAKLKALNDERAKQGEKALDRVGYEGYLRKKLTVSNQQFGYRDGAIFRISVSGEPKNPVGGSVYIGTAGITLKVPE